MAGLNCPEDKPGRNGDEGKTYRAGDGMFSHDGKTFYQPIRDRPTSPVPDGTDHGSLGPVGIQSGR
jgi:hypothetical protein